MGEQQEELTAESLAVALDETGGLIETLLKVENIRTVAELSAYIAACRSSPVHLRQLFEKLQPKRR